MASSRRTYDTDSITLRTVFAKNPGNSNVPALRALTADGAGGTFWAVPSSLGLNPSFNEIITSAATYTADLSYNKFRLLAGENIGMVNGSAGSNQTTLFAKAFSQFDLSGGNTLQAFSGNQLDSSVLFAGENGIVLRSDPGTNTLFIGGATASNTTISTGIYGFNQVKVTPSASTITSSLLTWGGDFLTASSPSSLLRFLGYNDIQLSTNVTTNSIFFTISTFTSEGYLNISNVAYSAGPSTLSTVAGLYVTSSFFGSTIAYFSTLSVVNYSTIQSSITGLSISTGVEIVTLQGLVNARATIVQLNSEIANVNSNLISTVTGLGSAGYISTAGGGSGDVTKANLLSTVAGLGTADYVSTLSLYSTLSTFSTALGSIGSGDVSQQNLASTVAGLGTAGYVSSLSTIITSTIFNTGAISTYSLEVFGSNTLTNSGSTILRGAVYLQGPLYVANTVSGDPGTIVNANNLISTTFGLQTSGFLSTSVILSTVTGLGSIGYLSSLSSLYLSTGNIKTANIELSTINFKDVGNGLLRELNSSNNALYFNGSAVGSGNVINNFNTSSYIYQVSSVSTIFAYDSVVISSANAVYLLPTYFSSVWFSTGALKTSSIEFRDTQTGGTQLLAVNNGVLQLNGNPIQGDVTVVNLRSTIANLGTSGYISTASLISTTFGLQTSGFLSTPSLISTTFGLQTSGFLSTPSLISTTFGLQTSGFISSANLTSTVTGLSNIVVTKLIAGSNIILTPSGGQGQVTIDATGGGGGITTANLVSTTFGLETSGFISSTNLTSTVSGLSNIVVTKLIAGTNITLTPANGQGEVTIDAAGGGGGGITAAQLTSTATRWATYPAVSSIVFANDVDSTRNEIVSPGLTFLNLVNDIGVYVTTITNVDGITPFTPLTASQFSITDQINFTKFEGANYNYTVAAGESYTGTISTLTITNSDGSLGSLYISSVYLAAPEGAAPDTAGALTTDVTATKLFYSTNQLANVKVNVVVSTLGAANPQLFLEDIGKYFLFSTATASLTVNLPAVENGWNAVIKNLEGSTENFTVNTTSPVVLAPGVVTTVVCDGLSFYSL